MRHVYQVHEDAHILILQDCAKGRIRFHAASGMNSSSVFLAQISAKSTVMRRFLKLPKAYKTSALASTSYSQTDLVSPVKARDYA